MEKLMLSERNQRAIGQYAKKNGLDSRTKEVLDTLEEILPLLGEQSRSRHMINRIGIRLLQDRVVVIAPSCPDYSHRNGIYTLESVGRGVPLLAQLHIKLLSVLAVHIPRLVCEIVIADQEADDEILCARIRMSRDAFRDCIKSSVDETRKSTEHALWKVGLMTERFPDLRELEETFFEEIVKSPDLGQRIVTDTIARGDMYYRLGIRDPDVMRMRTIRTASQYCALAHIASRDGLLICNHETVNLSWYNQHNAAVLHNEVSIY